MPTSHLESLIGALDEIILVAVAAGIILWILVSAAILDLVVALTAGVILAVPLAILGYLLLRPQLQAPQVGAETFIGRHAQAVTCVAPRGMVTVDGVYWSAESTEDIDAGEEVEVFAFTGTKLLVRRPVGHEAEVGVKSGN